MKYLVISTFLIKIFFAQNIDCNNINIYEKEAFECDYIFPYNKDNKHTSKNNNKNNNELKLKKNIINKKSKLFDIIKNYNNKLYLVNKKNITYILTYNKKSYKLYKYQNNIEQIKLNINKNTKIKGLYLYKNKPVFLGYIYKDNSENAYLNILNQNNLLIESKANERFYSIAKTLDGFIVVGSSFYNKLQGSIVKLDNSFNYISKNTINEFSCIKAIEKENSNSFIIAGYKNNQASIANIDANGKIKWIKKLNQKSEFNALIILNNYIYVAGEVIENRKKAKATVIKYDLNGNKIWEKIFNKNKWCTILNLIPNKTKLDIIGYCNNYDYFYFSINDNGSKLIKK